MSLKGKKLLICEEALHDYAGHYYTWIKAIRHLNLERGAEVLVAGHREMRESIQKEFSATRTYSINSWAGTYNHPLAWVRYCGVFRHNLLVWRETSRLLAKTGRVDCILLLAARIHHLLAWRMLCATGLGSRFKRLVCFVPMSEAVYCDDYSRFVFKPTTRLLKSTIRSYANAVRSGKVVFGGDSHITCKEYEFMTGLPFRTFPSPGISLQMLRQNARDDRERAEPVFLTLGKSTFDKGIDILQDALLQLLAAHPDFPAKFIIHWATPTIDTSGASIAVDPRLRGFRQVVLIEQVLCDEEYRDWFSQCDFVVLPYRRSTYHSRISGVAVEAACAAKPMIVTRNTWLSWALHEFGAGIEVNDCDPADLCRGLVDAVREQGSLRERARIRQADALRCNSSERYLQCLWEK